jgi:hypothetical protein
MVAGLRHHGKGKDVDERPPPERRLKCWPVHQHLVVMGSPLPVEAACSAVEVMTLGAAHVAFRLTQNLTIVCFAGLTIIEKLSGCPFYAPEALHSVSAHILHEQSSF